MIRVIQRRHPTVTVDSSTSREKVSLLFRTSLAPVRTPGGTRSPEERVALARNELIARVAKKVSLSVQVPGSVRPFIIGARGKTLKQIIDFTGAEIHIPRREEGQDGSRPDAELPSSPELNGDDADSAPILITISGEEVAANAARDQILAIVDQRTSRTTERVTSIPPEHYRFVNGPHGSKMAAIVNAVAGTTDGDEPPDVSVHVPRYRSRASNRHVLLSPRADSTEDHAGASAAPEARDDAIVVTGHRDLVGKVAEAIEAAYIDLKRGLRNFDIDVPRRQHRLVAQAADEIFEKTRSIVLVPAPSEQKDKISILGDQMANVQALQLVMVRARPASCSSPL